MKQQSSASAVYQTKMQVVATQMMDWTVFLTVSMTALIAELGDKTQLATMLFAASAVLIVPSAVGVLAGSVLSYVINKTYLHDLAGSGFIAMGVSTMDTAS